MKAVIDTNVLVSAFMAKRPDSPTVRILKAIVEGRFTPLYAGDIIAEYREVLARPHFRFNQKAVAEIIDRIVSTGLPIVPAESDEAFPDPDDKIFYCVAQAESDDGAKLVTGNLRHYPTAAFVVSPAEFCALIGV